MDSLRCIDKSVDIHKLKKENWFKFMLNDLWKLKTIRNHFLSFFFTYPVRMKYNHCQQILRCNYNRCHGWHWHKLHSVHMDYELRTDGDKLHRCMLQLENNLRCVCIGLCVFGICFFFFLYICSGANVKEKNKTYWYAIGVIYKKIQYMVQCVKWWNCVEREKKNVEKNKAQQLYALLIGSSDEKIQ